MPEWNGMEDFKNQMEDNFPYFHTNFMRDFVNGNYRKYIMIVINNILTEVLNIIFVDKSRYFGYVYCANKQICTNCIIVCTWQIAAWMQLLLTALTQWPRFEV